MTDQQSPWSQPDTEVVVGPGTCSQSPSSTPALHVGGRIPPSAPAVPSVNVASGYRSGNVSGLTAPPPPPPPDVIFGGPEDDDDDPVKRNRRIMKWLGVS